MVKRQPVVRAHHVEIHLTKGLVSLVDHIDAEVAASNWYALRGTNSWYAATAVPRGVNDRGPRQVILLHRLIAERMGLSTEGLDVDHRDLNGLNNLRSNLRLATRGQNLANQPILARNTSGFKGVSWDKETGKWRAQLKTNGKVLNLGRYAALWEAAEAYKRAAAKHHGEFARTGP